MRRGPRREVVEKIRDRNGFVVVEVLSCGHRLETAEIKAQHAGRKNRIEYSLARHCARCCAVPDAVPDTVTELNQILRVVNT